MKLTLKSLTALTLLVTGYSHAAVIYQANDGSNIDLYGRLGFNISDKKSGDTSGDFDARIGFSARQAINDKLAVIGFTQYQVNAAEYANNISAEDPDDFTARYVWAGIDFAEYGKITGGRVSSGLIMFTDIGDVFASSDVAMARQANFVDPTAVQVFRQDGTIQYQNTFGNFDFSTAYILGNNTSDLDYGYNAALRYTLDMGDFGRLQPVIAGQAEKASHDETSMQSDDNADKYAFMASVPATTWVISCSVCSLLRIKSLILTALLTVPIRITKRHWSGMSVRTGPYVPVIVILKMRMVTD